MKIKKKGQGWCFSQVDFHEAGSYDAIRQTLARLTQSGFIRRLATGIFYYPRYHEKLGELPPNIDEVIEAIQRAHKIRCQPSGAYAANMLGLSEQVPAKIVILTDGASKKIKLENSEIIFKKTTPRNMAAADLITGLIIQALKYIGKEHITNEHLNRIKIRLTDKDRLELRRHSYLAPAWIAKLINKKILEE